MRLLLTAGRRLEASKPSLLASTFQYYVLNSVWLATDNLYSDMTSLCTQRKLLTKLFLMNDNNGSDTIVRSTGFLPQRLSYRYDAWWEAS